jgi:hypothetical protein
MIFAIAGSQSEVWDSLKNSLWILSHKQGLSKFGVIRRTIREIKLTNNNFVRESSCYFVDRFLQLAGEKQ